MAPSGKIFLFLNARDDLIIKDRNTSGVDYIIQRYLTKVKISQREIVRINKKYMNKESFSGNIDLSDVSEYQLDDYFKPVMEVIGIKKFLDMVISDV